MFEGRNIELTFSGNREAIVTALLAAGALPGIQEKKGVTPLHRAASQGSVWDARKLLAAGASASAEDTQGMSAMHRAAAWGYTPFVQILIEHGVDPRKADKFKRTAAKMARDGKFEALHDYLLAHTEIWDDKEKSREQKRRVVPRWEKKGKGNVVLDWLNALFLHILDSSNGNMLSLFAAALAAAIGLSMLLRLVVPNSPRTPARR